MNKHLPHFGLLALFALVFTVFAAVPATAQDTPQGGTLTIAMWETRDVFNPYMDGGETFQSYVSPVLERLISFDANGDPHPILTTEVPTLDNGLMSADGKDITFKLRSGVKWADGEPFTCDDVAFTVSAVQNTNNIVTTRAGFDQITSVECKDSLTAIFHYKDFYGGWMSIPWFVVPKHILDKGENWNDNPWNKMPIGTGPFYVCESIPNDHFTWCKNPYYWQEGKPLLDKIVVLWVTDREALKSRFVGGDFALAYGISELDATEIKDTPDLFLYMEYGGGLEELAINLSPSTGEHQGDPAYKNPIVGDLKVRQALELATPKQEIVDSILGGLDKVIESNVPAGWGFNPDIPLSEYNPDKAKAMLDEAGWVVGSDGVRSKDGLRMHITLMGSTAKYRLLYMQLLQQEWGNIGAEVELLTPDPNVRWMAWAPGGGGVRNGAADVQAWGTGFNLDPIAGYNQFYRCDQMPSEQNPNFWNVSRYCNPDFEKALDAATHELDFEKRKALYREAALIMHNDLVTIPLYQQPRISAINTKQLGGYMPAAGPNYWEYPFTYAADWFIPAAS